MAGRPSQLTDDLEKRICNLLTQGVIRTTACVACGLGLSTFYRWLEWGTTRTVRDGHRNKIIKARPRYRQFREAVERAESMAEALLVQTVRKGAYEMTVGANGEAIITVRDWHAAAWLLERRNPGQYGRAAVERESEEVGTPETAGPKKVPVVFGARYLPNGELKVPLLPENRAHLDEHPCEEENPNVSKRPSDEPAPTDGYRPRRSGDDVPDL